MIKKLKEFLVENDVFQEYCDSVMEFCEDYTNNSLSSHNWDYVIDSMFGWEDSNDFLEKEITWSRINAEWKDEHGSNPSYFKALPYKTPKEFLEVLLKKDKKRILMSKIKEVTWKNLESF